MANNSATGGKDGYIRHVMNRKGVSGSYVSEGTGWETNVQVSPYKQRILKLDAAVSALAHPKKEGGKSEDAHFIIHRRWGNEHASEVIYI